GPQVTSLFHRAFGRYSGPFVVKPVSGRASLHVHVVADVASLPDAVAAVYAATENLVLIEKYLPGREFCIAVAGPVTSRGRFLMRAAEPFPSPALDCVWAPVVQIFTSFAFQPHRPRPRRPVPRGRQGWLSWPWAL